MAHASTAANALAVDIIVLARWRRSHFIERWIHEPGRQNYAALHCAGLGPGKLKKTNHMFTARSDGCRYPLDEWAPIEITVAGCLSLGISTMLSGRELES